MPRIITNREELDSFENEEDIYCKECGEPLNSDGFCFDKNCEPKDDILADDELWEDLSEEELDAMEDVFEYIEKYNFPYEEDD